MGIEVWIADVDSLGSIPGTLMELLDETEAARFRRFRLGADRRRFLVSRILLRKALSSVAAADPRDWRFKTDSNGKPQLSIEHELPQVSFNISHSAGAVAVAMSTAGEVGVDIERLEAAPAASSYSDESLLESVFTERELESLKSQPAYSGMPDTLRMWTVKEAYAKLIGIGAKLEAFDFEVAPSPWRIRHEDESTLRLETHEVELASGSYHMALAARSLSEPAVVRVLNAL